VISWTVVSQLSWQYLHDRPLVYHIDRQALSTAWFRRTGPLATVDTCISSYWRKIVVASRYCLSLSCIKEWVLGGKKRNPPDFNITFCLAIFVLVFSPKILFFSVDSGGFNWLCVSVLSPYSEHLVSYRVVVIVRKPRKTRRLLLRDTPQQAVVHSVLPTSPPRFLKNWVKGDLRIF